MEDNKVKTGTESMPDNSNKGKPMEQSVPLYKSFSPLTNKPTPAPVRKPVEPVTIKVKPTVLPTEAPKTKAQIKEEVKDVLSTFGSAGVDDINRNVGKFTSTVVEAEDEEPSKEIKLDADAKVVEKAANEKINFERFSRTKKNEKAARTKFGERVSLMLRNKKSLTITWVIELVVMALMMATGIVLVACLSKYNSATESGPWLLDEYRIPNKVGVVFAWIGIFPCLVPLVYLLIAWFVGINQVASSRLFHFIFWGALILSILCIIIALGCCAPMMDAILNWGGDFPKLN